MDKVGARAAAAGGWRAQAQATQPAGTLLAGRWTAGALSKLQGVHVEQLDLSEGSLRTYSGQGHG